MGSKDGGHLDPHDMRHSWRDISLAGAYRKLLAKSLGNMEWEVKAYDSKGDEQFVDTDLDRMGIPQRPPLAPIVEFYHLESSARYVAEVKQELRLVVEEKATDTIPPAERPWVSSPTFFFSQVAVNMFSIKKLEIMFYTSIALNTAGIGYLAIAILIKAKARQSRAFVFHKFFDGTGPDGPGWSVRASPVYVALIGVLMPQYTILGYDASAHLCEETKKAVRDGPLGLRRMPRRPRKRQTSTRWRSDRQTNPLDAVKSTQPVRKPNYQGSKSEEAQTTTDRRPKTKEKKKAMTELDTELDGNESDKENWVPGTQTMVVACPSPDASP
ncbi:MAG: hypothetical protein LQ350_005493 [Teloschistes chrysophthalmus]|nr:MAG: hypothetical protein LQ350_005493 [Niorma chrysophthalma]